MRVHYRLNIIASVRFTFHRVMDGRRVGRHCKARARSNRNTPRCTRYVAVPGNLTLMGNAANNTVRFSGRLSGHTLPPGNYQLIATPSANGDAGTSRGITFTILR
jgi:hypothetical protein